MSVVQATFGFFVLISIAWLLSENKGRFPWKLTVMAVVVQFALALILLKIPASQIVFAWLNNGVLAMQQALEAGTSLVFGFLGGGELPYVEKYPGASYVFAFRGLPFVVLLGALSALFYYWRILPMVIRMFAWLLGKTLGIGGAASFVAAANIFVGNVEAAILVKPYLEKISRSDLFILMVAGMATVAGTVFVLYSTLLQGVVENAAGHLLTASVISAPAAILLAQIMLPQDKEVQIGERVETLRIYGSAFDAITQGTIAGLRMLAYIIGMVMVLVAMVELLNLILGNIYVADKPLSLQMIFGWVLAPFAWLIGIPWSEATLAGQLLGTKIVLNELISYFEMGSLHADALSDRSYLILTYAMCGFANFGGLGVMLAGLVGLVPDRRDEILELGVKALIAGNLATLMTGAVVAIVV